MATWRCGRCGTLQADSDRCWVCSRSAVSCSTCRNFRRSVAGGLGYCALDRARVPLRGDEVHACWQAPLEPADTQDEGLFAMRSRALADGARPRPGGPVTPRSVARIPSRSDGAWHVPDDVPKRRSILPIRRERTATGPGIDEPEHRIGRLVEAPVVRPAPTVALLSEGSAELEGDGVSDDRPVL